MNKYVPGVVVCLLLSCSGNKQLNPHIDIKTNYGKIEIELYPRQAPRSVAAFLSHIDADLYKKASFYRVLNMYNQPSAYAKAELIQGGIHQSNRKHSETIAAIPHETTEQSKILHKDGVISFARLAPGTAKTEFFICIGDQPGFDYEGDNNADKQGYAAFGRVVRGMNVVRKIANAPENDQSFDPPVDIIEIVRK